jgi:lactoylglutathione lyase
MFGLRLFRRTPFSPMRCFSSTERPFRILGLQQVALGNTDKQKLSHFWGTLLGATKVKSFTSEK